MTNDERFIFLVQNGTYRIDKNGNIYRMRKMNNKGFFIYFKKGIKQGIKDNKGYLKVTFKMGKIRSIYSHRVVWMYFNGDIPKGKEVNHKNGIKEDNDPENLELMTHKKNIEHAINVIGTMKVKGEDNPQSVLKEIDILIIRDLGKKGKSNEYLSNLMGVSKSQISKILNRKRWKHI